MQRVPGSVDQCPVCRDPLFADYPDRAIALCRSCKGAHHRDCWTYAGRCAQFGCGSTDFVEGKAVFQEDRAESLEAPIANAARPPGTADRVDVETKGVIRQGDPLVYVTQSLARRIVELGDRTTENGVAGILTGERCSWLGDEYSKVEDMPAFLRPRSAASLVSDGAWQKELETGEKTVLGWWAILRGTGVHLGAPELRLHRTCFERPWMVCFVLDPTAQTLGFFGWNAGKIVSTGFRLVKDQEVAGDQVFGGR